MCSWLRLQKYIFENHCEKNDKKSRFLSVTVFKQCQIYTLFVHFMNVQKSTYFTLSPVFIFIFVVFISLEVKQF